MSSDGYPRLRRHFGGGPSSVATDANASPRAVVFLRAMHREEVVRFSRGAREEQGDRV
ncbi:hypothetical protein TRAPUB_14378 [Trametes pubescens]|uniref:Uncharacterized protein n=1 Tax=Trametes pubescens TaxID=154538 RepID=A0A1M2VNM4_TRAPU|nr:hypothetical protein TRAPUB_14378 [Trametes pubescens]